jgi:hypothetical protein
MDKRHLATLYAFLFVLTKARRRPLNQIHKWEYLQMMVLKKIVYLEKRIIGYRNQIAELKRNLSTLGKIKSKAEAAAHKQSIAKKEDQIQELQRLLPAFRSIVDAIAFTFINKYDIKPLVFKEKAGFISGKKGLKIELKIFHACYKKGMIAILNDLTTVLRYSDITLLKDGQLFPIEVKTSEITNTRTLRQREKAEQIFSYLEMDKATELYGMKGEIRRVAMKVPEKNYLKHLKRTIDRALIDGIACSSPERGILYMAVSGDVDLKEHLDAAIRKHSIERPIVNYLNVGKFQEQGYYPFTLSLSPDHFMDFLSGDLGLIVMIDLKEIERIAEKHSLLANYASDQPWVLEFRSKKNEPMLQMSYHLLGRVFYEFISLKNLLEDGFTRVSGLAEAIAEKGAIRPACEE